MVFAPASLILTNYHLPIIWALCFKWSFEQLYILGLIIKVFLLTAVLSSCAPVPRDFHKPIYEGGSLISQGCGSSGPLDTMVIQLTDGVEVTVRASSSDSDYAFVNFYVKTYITAQVILATSL